MGDVWTEANKFKYTDVKEPALNNLKATMYLAIIKHGHFKYCSLSNLALKAYQQQQQRMLKSYSIMEGGIVQQSWMAVSGDVR